MTPTREDIHRELMGLAARSEFVAIRLPRRRRPGIRGWVSARLPAMVRIVKVTPVTFAQWSEIDQVVAGKKITRWEWRRIRAWIALRETYGLSFEEFCSVFPDAESIFRLMPVVDAWDRVNASFRAGVESPVGGRAISPEPVPSRYTPVGGLQPDPRAA